MEKRFQNYINFPEDGNIPTKSKPIELSSVQVEFEKMFLRELPAENTEANIPETTKDSETLRSLFDEYINHLLIFPRKKNPATEISESSSSSEIIGVLQTSVQVLTQKLTAAYMEVQQYKALCDTKLQLNS